MDVLKATILGMIVGVSGTLCGGLLVMYRFAKSLPKQSWLLGFSGGVMAAVVLFDLWPEAWHFGGFYPTAVGTGVGFLLVQYFDQLLPLFPWYRRHSFSKHTRTGILLGLGIGVHNFPEGVALGTAYIANGAVSYWLGLALVMSIHNVPEGMVMAAAFQLGRVRISQIILSLILVELPMALGGMTGALLGKISPWMVAFSLGFAGGAMFLLVGKELLPMARKIAGFFWVGTGFLTGILIGIILVKIV